MRWMGVLVASLLWIPAVWATSDDTLSVTPSATSGTTITAADENARNAVITTTFNAHSHVNDTELDKSARVYNSSTFALTSGTAAVITFDSERWDTDTIHSTSSNTSRLTATTAGKYQISGSVEFASVVSHDPTANDGQRRLEVLLNGATVIASHDCTEKPWHGPGYPVRCAITTHYQLSATDYVELRATQRVSSSLNVTVGSNYSPEFEMVKVP